MDQVEKLREDVEEVGAGLGMGLAIPVEKSITDSLREQAQDLSKRVDTLLRVVDLIEKYPEVGEVLNDLGWY